jgi:UPF0716 protein FxsA
VNNTGLATNLNDVYLQLLPAYCLSLIRSQTHRQIKNSFFILLAIENIMPILPLFLLLFISIPLIEIYLLIEVGGAIGALPTVIAVVSTAVLGITLIRIQGFSTLQKAQHSMAQGVPPAMEMFEGVMLLIAALCLLMPGFFTDTLGFLLLVPPLRKLLASFIIGSAILKSRNVTARNSTNNDYYEGTYEDITTKTQAQNSLHQGEIVEDNVRHNETKTEK